MAKDFGPMTKRAEELRALMDDEGWSLDDQAWMFGGCQISALGRLSPDQKERHGFPILAALKEFLEAQ